MKEHYCDLCGNWLGRTATGEPSHGYPVAGPGRFHTCARCRDFLRDRKHNGGSALLPEKRIEAKVIPLNADGAA